MYRFVNNKNRPPGTNVHDTYWTPEGTRNLRNGPQVYSGRGRKRPGVKVAPLPLSLRGPLQVLGGETEPELVGRAGLGRQPEASFHSLERRDIWGDGRHSSSLFTLWVLPACSLCGFQAVLPQRRKRSRISISDSSFLHPGVGGTLRNQWGRLRSFSDGGEKAQPLEGGKARDWK